MGILFLAHAGHDHAAIGAATPWWADQPTVSIVIVVVFAIGLAAAHLAKVKPATTLFAALLYLLVVGLVCYRVAPVASTAALAVGIIIALASTLAQLGHKK